MTVGEYLNFVYDLKGVQSPSRTEHLEQIQHLVGIKEVYGRLIKNLSKGYRQRVGLAQALIGDPDVLILDEPTVGLDPRQIVEIRNVIKNLGKSRTVILSTHILPEVSAICERVLVISNGVIVADGKPEDLGNFDHSERDYRIRVAGPKDAVASLLKSRDGVRQVDAVGEFEAGSTDFLLKSAPNMDIRKPLFFALASAGFPVLMLKPENASLEDIFIKLTEDSTSKLESSKEKKRQRKKDAALDEDETEEEKGDEDV
jgi:ABC-2 type transport system ATP-binding protein